MTNTVFIACSTFELSLVEDMSLPPNNRNVKRVKCTFKYFQSKKELKRGPFNLLVKNRKNNEDGLDLLLNELALNLRPFFHSKNFGLADILIYSHLVGVYVVPGYQLPGNIFQYMKNIESISGFDYQKEMWVSNKVFSDYIRSKS